MSCVFCRDRKENSGPHPRKMDTQTVILMECCCVDFSIEFEVYHLQWKTYYIEPCNDKLADFITL